MFHLGDDLSFCCIMLPMLSAWLINLRGGGYYSTGGVHKINEINRLMNFFFADFVNSFHLFYFANIFFYFLLFYDYFFLSIN